MHFYYEMKGKTGHGGPIKLRHVLQRTKCAYFDTDCVCVCFRQVNPLVMVPELGRVEEIDPERPEVEESIFCILFSNSPGFI